MNFFIGVLIFTLSVLFKPAHAVDANDGEKLFALKIMPLFSQKCLPCHGGKPNKIKSKFDMRSRESILLGGEIFGAEVLKPGRGEKSYLYLFYYLIKLESANNSKLYLLEQGPIQDQSMVIPLHKIHITFFSY